VSRKAGKIVSSVTYEPTGEHADIRLLKAPMRFRVEVGDEHFEDKDGDKVAEWALAALKRNRVTVWTPVIELFMPECRYEASDSVLFDYRRFYIGRTTKAWRQVPWDNFDADAPAKMADAITELTLRDSGNYNQGKLRPDNFDGMLPYRSHVVEDDDYDWEEDPAERERMIAGAKRGVLMAYDETTWNIIVEIGDTIRRARAKLVSLVEKPEGFAALAGAAPPTILALTS
jgi:hypothetical protein